MIPELNYERDFKGPQKDNEIQIGKYYYGIHCPHCSETSPLIQTVNANMVGAWIETIATDDIWEASFMKHDHLQSKLSPKVKETIKDKIIEVTPTVIWGDGLVMEGAPYDNNSLNVKETREYLCIRAAKCYLKKSNPGMHTDEINNLIDQVFGGRFVMKRTEEGVKRDPYKGLREITWRF